MAQATSCSLLYKTFFILSAVTTSHLNVCGTQQYNCYLRFSEKTSMYISQQLLTALPTLKDIFTQLNKKCIETVESATEQQTETAKNITADAHLFLADLTYDRLQYIKRVVDDQRQINLLLPETCLDIIAYAHGLGLASHIIDQLKTKSRSEAELLPATKSKQEPENLDHEIVLYNDVASGRKSIAQLDPIDLWTVTEYACLFGDTELRSRIEKIQQPTTPSNSTTTLMPPSATHGLFPSLDLHNNTNNTPYGLYESDKSFLLEESNIQTVVNETYNDDLIAELIKLTELD